MDDPVDNFTSITGATADIARRYLGMTDNNFEQAIQLFFDSPDLASGIGEGSSSAAPPILSSTRPPPRASGVGRQDAPVHIESDDEDMNIDEDDDAAAAARAARAAEVEDDAAYARRMQEELYAGGDASGSYDADGVRAPMGRTTETLVGGPEGDWTPDDMQEAVLQQMRARQQPRPSGRPGVFNQRPIPSIWDESADADQRRQGFAAATAGASEQSSKAARLAELFRPPFELMNQIPWDTARDKGKEEGKWILVNVQDPSIFDCQQLNRDIWKHEGIRELVKENFVFMQYSKDDPRGSQYIQYYFHAKDSDDAYPHIAIVDPRTGEQVKTWSGPPVPVAGEFLMQLVEFLDRYSLDVTKKNPVARRKPEKPKALDVDRLTEEEMLELALQNSLANGETTGPKEHDPDDLTKSFGDVSKGKGKEIDEEVVEPTNGHLSDSPFSSILSNNPHAEPAPGPNVTRLQIRHSNGRVVRRFDLNDPVRRIYEWLKAEPFEGKEGVPFDLKVAPPMSKDLLECLDETIEAAGLKNSTLMVEFLED